MIDQPRVKPNAPVLTVRFFLRHGAMVEWPVPQGQPFTMTALVHGIRGVGFFVADDLYIPAEEIACIGLSGAAAKVTQPQHRSVQ
jgi:hypothetical protein